MSKIVDELVKEYNIYKLLEFDEFNLKEKIQNNSYLLMKFQDQLLKEEIKLDEYNELYEKLVGECYHKYRFEIDESLSKTEIEKYYLPRDKKIVQMKKILNKQKIRIKFFESCIKGIEKQYWNMKEFANQITR